MVVEPFEVTDKKFKKYYWRTKVRMILIGTVIIGALNWGAEAFGYNLVKMFSDFLNRIFSINFPFDKLIYIDVAVAGILLSMERETWLPFLGTSVLPDSLIPLKTPEKSDTKITLKTMPNAKIVYWASLPKGETPDVITAYGDFSNSGVVVADSDGKAELPILTGSKYKVPSGRIIDRHIHYRIVGLPYGLMSKVKTINY